MQCWTCIDIYFSVPIDVSNQQNKAINSRAKQDNMKTFLFYFASVRCGVLCNIDK